jgi:lipopolysaccharide export system ATP-binding protein
MALFSFGSKKPAKVRKALQPALAYADAGDPQAFDERSAAYEEANQMGGQFGAPSARQPNPYFDPHLMEPEPYVPHDLNAEPETGEGLLTAHNVQKSYKGRKVVKGVSLAVGRGESVGLLGPNGAGKTTSFYMITGLVGADAGTVTIDGRNVTRLPMYRRARLGIGYLPQEASIFRGLTVEQNIMAVLELVEPKKKVRQQRLDQLLEEFKITRLRKSPSIALSGGERRRCEIARALASNPSFILLDEPFAGIDPLAVGDIQDLVRHLTARDIGVLITDHNVRETLSLVDRAYVIADGQVLTHGTPQEVVQNEDVRRVYLGNMFG